MVDHQYKTMSGIRISRREIEGKLHLGVSNPSNGFTHMLVAINRKDLSHFFVYASSKNEALRKIKTYAQVKGQEIVEVYDLSIPFEDQDKSTIVWSIEKDETVKPTIVSAPIAEELKPETEGPEIKEDVVFPRSEIESIIDGLVEILDNLKKIL